MNFEKKKQSIVDKNGIESFGYELENLEIFTNNEIWELNHQGLIYDGDRTKILMQRGK